MRINKFISLCGIASRRAADTLVAEGRVQVNGETVTDLGHQVDENAHADARHILWPEPQHVPSI